MGSKMRMVKIPGGEAQVMEPGDQPIGTSDMVKSDEQVLILAAIATIEKEAPTVFSSELKKIKQKTQTVV